MKIKVKLFNKFSNFGYIKKGEWIDLRSAKDYTTEAPIAKRARKDSERDVIFKYHMIPLGIGMKLPEGYEAIIVPRSSTFKNYGILQINNVGVIDSTYSGPNDQWMYPCIDIVEGKTIGVGDRICQFRIQLSQKATIWQKIKWLFTNKIEFEFVDDYEGEDRCGFGSTGK
jgi:dUTP pyrophosphatase